MKVVLCGEAWGRREAQFQHALVGPSGRELTLQLGIAGLAPFMLVPCHRCKTNVEFIEAKCPNCQGFIWPNEFTLMDHWKRLRNDLGIAVTNVFNIQPEGNDLGHFFGFEPETPMPSWKASRKTGGSHVKAEHFHHIKRLWSELCDLKPNLVIALGNAACWALLGQTKITALRGTVNWTSKELTGLEIKCLATFHPASVIRPTGRAMRPTVIADLQKARREAEFPEIRRTERFITIPAPNESGIGEIEAWFYERPLRLSSDIETIRGQISIIGFGRSASEALVIPFRDAHSKDGKIIQIGKIARDLGFKPNGINYWPTADLEVRAWTLAVSGIEAKDIELIFQNGLYDLSYFLRMGMRPYGAKDDTMLFHHSEYPELPKDLGYLGSLYCDEIAWKQMSRQDSQKRDE